MGQAGSPDRSADGARAINTDFIFWTPTASPSETRRDASKILVDEGQRGGVHIKVDSEVDGATGRLADLGGPVMGGYRITVARRVREIFRLVRMPLPDSDYR